MSSKRFVFPTSFAQRRLWFVDQLEPESAHYNVSLALGLTGALDVAALQRALAHIVERHEALRTTFVVRDGEPVQVVGPAPEIDMPVREVAGLSEAELQDLIDEEAYRPFDLERGPLLRARLLRRGPGEHALLLAVHHIVFDGWSAGVLYRELGHGYAAYATDGVPDLPPLPVQYGDYAVWQREWLTGETLDRQVAYWRAQLAGASPTLELPPDRARPRLSTHRGSSETVLLPPPMVQGLTALSRREGTTLFMTLLAGFQSLLGRYGGTDDVTVGSPTANRTRVELEPLIGFFVNSLALRTDVSGDPSFRTLLGRVRETSLGAFDHQDLPFEKLVEELRPERVGDRNPLFQVMFAVQNATHPPLRLPGLTVRHLRRRMGRSKFDLSFAARETADGLRLDLDYSTDLFEASTIRRMLGHLEQLFAGALADPDRRLSAVSLLSPEERRRLVADGGRPARAPSAGGVHERFQLQAARRPDAVAVEAPGQRVTYGALNRRANRLARLLRRRGVRRHDRVAVALGRSPELPMGLLGVLKAGAAYVPLEPDTPPDRLARLLADARVSALVTRAGAAPRLPVGVVSVDLDTDAGALAEEREDEPAIECAPDQLACVLYPPGSTGRFEGTAVSHRAIVHLACDAEDVRLTAADRVAQAADASHEAALFEIWGTLLGGARLLVLPLEAMRSPAELATRVREGRVSAICLTTAWFHQLARDQPDLFGPLRLVLFGGEPADPARVREVLAHGPPERLLHVYGHPETGSFAMRYAVGAMGEHAATVPIGEPLGDGWARVLDRKLEPVPVGVPGELYLGGPCLALGYLDRPALTARRFVPDPFGSEPGARLFRTGDRVRRRADGALELLGRVDDAGRPRGYRLEASKVEAALGQHPLVRECAVILRDDLPGGRGLVAYLTQQQTSNGAGPPRASESPQEHLSAWWAERDEAALRSLAEGQAPPERVERTVERILTCTTNRVLELGCGDGALLLRLAPHTLRYVATGSSAAVLAALRRRVEAANLGDRVALLERGPLDFAGLQRESADLVILDSVARYLPSIDHLVRLLEDLTPLLAPGGAIFLGDLRNADLLAASHAAIELQRAPPDLPTDELRRRVRSRVEAEEELVVSPRFFASLPRYFYRIRRVRVLPRLGRTEGDTAAYRYDAILHSTGTPSAADPLPRWTEWGEVASSLESLGRLLREDGPPALAIRGVPDARTAAYTWAAGALAGPAAPATAGELVEAGRAAARSAVDPDALLELGEALGYRVDMSWERSDASGRFDVLFQRGRDRAGAWPAQRRPARLPWDRYANRPRLKTAAAALVPALRTHLRERLPEFLIPRALVLLDTLPRSADGGLDLAALPRPARNRLAGESPTAGPRTPVERELAALWQRLLGIESVGLEDNFFDLGGHSLLAIKLFAEIERTFGRKLPLSTLYQAPSLGLLADAIAEASPDRPGSALAVLQPRGSRPPLFLVHGPQGDVLEYRYLVARLGADQPVYGLEAQDEGDPAPRTIEQLAAGYVEQLRREQPAGPYQLCGYCWAGTLTFEIARQLRAAGGEVALVALIDAACPGYRAPRRPARAVGRRRSLRTRILHGLERLPELEVTAVLRFLREGMVRLATEVAGVPAFRWSVRLGRPLLPAFRGRRQALLYAARAYRPASYPGRLTLLRGWLGTAETEPDALWGWDRVAAEGVELHRVPGTHLELMTEPRVERVAAALRACLARGHADLASEEEAEECGSRP